MARVLVAGHICLDVIPTLRQAPDFTPGNLYEIGAAEFAPGGGVPNVGLALARLGIEATMLGQIGRDPFGAILRGVLDARAPGTGAGLQVGEGCATSYTVVLSAPGSDRIFLHHPGCNDEVRPSAVEIPADPDAEFFYFGYPPLMAGTYRDGGAALADLFRRARARGLATVLDLALPDPDGSSGGVDWRGFLARVLPEVDLVTPSVHETAFMLERRTPERVADDAPPTSDERGWAARLLELGAGMVALTMGRRGVLLASGDRPLPARDLGDGWRARELWAPAFEAEVVGTTGAGDATTAGLLAALVRRLEPERALLAAAAVGACAVEAADATSGVRSWEDTLARIDDGWPRVVPVRDVPGWREVEGAYAPSP